MKLWKLWCAIAHGKPGWAHFSWPYMRDGIRYERCLGCGQEYRTLLQLPGVNAAGPHCRLLDSDLSLTAIQREALKRKLDDDWESLRRR